jgi:hypothetical protein
MNVQQRPRCSVHWNDEFDDIVPRSASFAIDAYGLQVGIRTNDSLIRELLPAHLPFGWAPSKSRRLDRRYSFRSVKQNNAGTNVNYVLRQGANLLTETEDLAEALQVFENDLELHVAACAPRHVFIHAGVVGWRGGAILIPGRSFSGKSSLVAALCHFGAVYYSDEFAILDREGFVHPYCRPLHLRKPVPHVPVANPGNVAEADAPGPLPIRLVVVTHYQETALWNPQPLSRGQAMLRLMANTMSTQNQPQAVLAVLIRSLQSAHVIQSPRGEAGEVANDLLSLASNCVLSAHCETVIPFHPGCSRNHDERSHEKSELSMRFDRAAV